MDRIKITAVILTALMLALSSCVRDVIMDAEERPTVVVECILTNSSRQELHLNFTKGASKAVAAPLTEAAATLPILQKDRLSASSGKVREICGLWITSRSAIINTVLRCRFRDMI